MDKQTTINGRIYVFGHIPPTRAIKVEVTLVKVLGGSLIKAFLGAKSGKQSKEELLAIGASAMAAMSERLTAEELEATMATVFEYASCDGERIIMDQTFRGGKHREMWSAFLYGLRYNFADFMPASLSLSSLTGAEAK